MGEIAERGARDRARILFLHPSDELYGADRVLLNLLSGIDRDRFEPLVVLANDLPYDGALSAELRARGIAVRSLPIAVARRKYLTPAGISSFSVRMYRAVRMLTRLMQEERIDLVYSNTLAVWSGALAAARLRLPHVWHVHELIARPAALGAFMRWFVPAYAQRVVCVSHAAFDHLLRASSARAVGVVLPNGVDARPWMDAEGRPRVRAEVGCASDDILVGMIGRVSTLKAPDLLVAVANDLIQRNLPVRCLFVGDTVPGQSEPLEALRHQITLSPAPERFSLLGYRRDIPDVTAALDILVVPSREPESFSLVSVQAMLAGKPVVAARVGALSETIEDGRTGILVQPENPAELALAVETLVRDGDLRVMMGMAGRERALARFDLQRQVRNFNGLLDETLSGAGRVPRGGSRHHSTSMFGVAAAEVDEDEADGNEHFHGATPR